MKHALTDQEIDAIPWSNTGSFPFNIRALARSVERIVTQRASEATATREGWVLAPDYRGYAYLGLGNYVINHTRHDAPPELMISIATEAEKKGRSVGDERDNAEGALIQPEVMAVRIGFHSLAGLDALEAQLRYLRAVHFPATQVAQPKTFEQWWSGLAHVQLGYSDASHKSVALTAWNEALANAAQS